MTASGRHPFATTRWSLVIAANSDDAHAGTALSDLCQAYWAPLYEYARRKGHDAEQAADLTQAFFAELLDKQFLRSADQKQGRFRTFLLTAFQRFLFNEFDKARALKRGGGQTIISLDAAQCESHLNMQTANRTTPEQVFERRWALTLLDRVLNQLQQEMTARGRTDVFECCRHALLEESTKSCAAIAVSLGMTESAVKVAIHRMRKRYRELLLQEVTHTLANPDDLMDEIRALLSAVG